MVESYDTPIGLHLSQNIIGSGSKDLDCWSIFGKELGHLSSLRNSYNQIAVSVLRNCLADGLSNRFGIANWGWCVKNQIIKDLLVI